MSLSRPLVLDSTKVDSHGRIPLGGLLQAHESTAFCDTLTVSAARMTGAFVLFTVRKVVRACRLKRAIGEFIVQSVRVVAEILLRGNGYVMHHWEHLRARSNAPLR